MNISYTNNGEVISETFSVPNVTTNTASANFTYTSLITGPVITTCSSIVEAVDEPFLTSERGDADVQFQILGNKLLLL